MIRFLALILGAVWFFPVSCTLGVVGGIHMISKIDTRYVNNGDQLHGLFAVALEPGEDGAALQLIPLSEAQKLQQQGEFPFLLSSKTKRVDINEFTYISYTVIENDGSEQLIESIYSDDDNTIWSRYKASSQGIEPLSSKMLYFGYMFQALPWAFGGALALFFIGKLLRRRQQEIGAKTPNHPIKRTE